MSASTLPRRGSRGARRRTDGGRRGRRGSARSRSRRRVRRARRSHLGEPPVWRTRLRWITASRACTSPFSGRVHSSRALGERPTRGTSSSARTASPRGTSGASRTVRRAEVSAGSSKPRAASGIASPCRAAASSGPTKTSTAFGVPPGGRCRGRAHPALRSGPAAAERHSRPLRRARHPWSPARRRRRDASCDSLSKRPSDSASRSSAAISTSCTSNAIPFGRGSANSGGGSGAGGRGAGSSVGAATSSGGAAIRGSMRESTRPSSRARLARSRMSSGSDTSASASGSAAIRMRRSNEAVSATSTGWACAT